MFATALWLALWLSPEPLPEVSIDDLCRFPGFAYARWAEERSCWYRDAVAAYAEGHGFACQREAEWGRLAETIWVQEAWMALYAAYWQADYPTDERAAKMHLQELRRLIGPAAYYSGRMPPPIPVGRRRNSD